MLSSSHLGCYCNAVFISVFCVGLPFLGVVSLVSWEMWSSHSNMVEDSSPLRCDAASFWCVVLNSLMDCRRRCYSPLIWLELHSLYCHSITSWKTWISSALFVVQVCVFLLVCFFLEIPLVYFYTIYSRFMNVKIELSYLLQICHIWGSHSSVTEDSGLLAFEVVLLD